MVHFDEFLKTWSFWPNSVTRQASFNRTKIGGICKNSNATFWVIFKQCASVQNWLGDQNHYFLFKNCYSTWVQWLYSKDDQNTCYKNSRCYFLTIFSLHKNVIKEATNWNLFYFLNLRMLSKPLSQNQVRYHEKFHQDAIFWWFHLSPQKCYQGSH